MPRRRVRGFTAVDDVKLNGKLTLGENTADNGGAAHRADGLPGVARPASRRQTLDGFTPEQRVLPRLRPGAGARTCAPNARACWRRPTRTRRRRYRVNGVVSNMPEFAEGVCVQGGRADGARERVPGLVKDANLVIWSFGHLVISMTQSMTR